MLATAPCTDSTSPPSLNLFSRLHRRAFRCVAAAVLVTSASASACDGNATGAALTYVVLQGADQNGEAGATLGLIVIRVSDTRGDPQNGARLRATARSGGSVVPAEAVTEPNGEVRFTWTLGPTVGAQELQIVDVSRNTEFFVWASARAPAVAAIAVSPSSASLTAGQTQQFTATLRDSRGDLLTGKPVIWSSSNTSVASVAAVSGLVTGVSGGTATITATSENKSATATVNVSTGPPTQLSMLTNPAGAVDGLDFTVQPAVEVRDATGAVAAGSAPVAVTATIQSGQGALAGERTVQSVAGVARFSDLRITGVGQHTIAFSAPGLTGVTSASFLVADVSAPMVTITTTSLPNATQSQPYAVQLFAQGGSGTFAWSVAGGSLPAGMGLSATGVLSGTPTATGTSVFTVHAASGGLIGARQLSLTVVPVSGGQIPTQLTIGTQPAGAVNGVNFATQPTVVVRDALGSVVLGASAQVTASLASGTGVLSGTTTVAAINGVATFTNLRITGTGPHSLTFSSPSLASATSSVFSVGSTAGSAALAVGNATPVAVQAGQNIIIPIVLDMSNAGAANVASIQFTVNWDATRFDFVSGTVNGGSGFTLTPNTNNASNGTISVAGFAVTGVTATTTLYTIELTARVSAAGTSSNITATVGAAANQNGVTVVVTPRNLTVNINP